MKRLIAFKRYVWALFPLMFRAASVWGIYVDTTLPGIHLSTDFLARCSAHPVLHAEAEIVRALRKDAWLDEKYPLEAK